MNREILQRSVTREELSPSTSEKNVKTALKFGMSRDSPFQKEGITEVHPATKNILDNRKTMFTKLVANAHSPEDQTKIASYFNTEI